MVLAGGCVSGCLFKSGAGNLNSMIALLGIATGVALVEYGPLSAFHASLKTHVIKNAQGGSVTLSSLTGLPFWAWAAVFAIGTALAALFWPRRAKIGAGGSKGFTLKNKLTARAWRPWQAGLLIGVLGWGAYLSSAATGRNYPFGVTHGVMDVQLLLTDRSVTHVYKKAAAAPAAPGAPQAAVVAVSNPAPVGNPAAKAPATPQKKISWWLMLLVVSMVIGSWVSGRLSGEARLLPKPPEQVVIALIGGLLVGIGAGFAGGCVIGNITSGWALLSVGVVLFGVVVILANWATTYFYLMGGTLGDLFRKS
jgi:uncharacterized membrane protein YedE/YeeE